MIFLETNMLLLFVLLIKVCACSFKGLPKDFPPENMPPLIYTIDVRSRSYAENVTANYESRAIRHRTYTSSRLNSLKFAFGDQVSVSETMMKEEEVPFVLKPSVTATFGTSYLSFYMKYTWDFERTEAVSIGNMDPSRWNLEKCHEKFVDEKPFIHAKSLEAVTEMSQSEQHPMQRKISNLLSIFDFRGIGQEKYRVSFGKSGLPLSAPRGPFTPWRLSSTIMILLKMLSDKRETPAQFKKELSRHVPKARIRAIRWGHNFSVKKLYDEITPIKIDIEGFNCMLVSPLNENPRLLSPILPLFGAVAHTNIIIAVNPADILHPNDVIYVRISDIDKIMPFEYSFIGYKNIDPFRALLMHFFRMEVPDIWPLVTADDLGTSEFFH